MSRSEGRDLREELTARAHRLGHVLKAWKETKGTLNKFDGRSGKFVASCRACGALAIMYETTPAVGDGVTGKALTHECLKEGA
jgi:hypothetical protein